MRTLKHIKNGIATYDDGSFISEMQLISEYNSLLHKSIHQKPNFTRLYPHEQFIYTCPCCGSMVEYLDQMCDCGQALKWEGSNED